MQRTRGRSYLGAYSSPGNFTSSFWHLEPLMTLVTLAGASLPCEPRPIGAPGSRVPSLDCPFLALLERGWGRRVWGWPLSSGSRPPHGPATHHLGRPPPPASHRPPTRKRRIGQGRWPQGLRLPPASAVRSSRERCGALAALPCGLRLGLVLG